MAYKEGVVIGHYAFVEMLRRLAKSNALVGDSAYSGTGNGIMSGIGLTPVGSNEEWTVACLDDTTAGEELWSVTGSVSGAQAQYTTGNDYRRNDIEFTITAGGIDFVVGDTFTIRAATFIGTGNGTIDNVDGQPAGVTETWTVACTNAATPGAEVWSVTGSISGAQASATTGVAYTNTYISFTITAGGTNFAVSDQFVIAMRQGDLAGTGGAWVEDRYDDTNLNGESQIDLEMVLRGPGLSGTEQVWAAITTNQSANSDFYNLSLSTMIGYVPGNALADQPNFSGQRWIPAWNLEIPYWIAINGQRITFGLKIETHYPNGHVGKYYAYQTPGQFPYPICVAGTSAGSTTRYSEAWGIDLNGGLRIRNITGAWETPKVAPWQQLEDLDATKQGMNQMFQAFNPRDTGGEYPLLPITLVSETYGAMGDLDGVYFVPGFNSAVENVVQADGYDHIKLSDNQGTGFQSYYALRKA